MNDDIFFSLFRTHPNWEHELSSIPTLMTNKQPKSVTKSSLVTESRANFTTWDPGATSEGRTDNGISRKMSPVSGSIKKCWKITQFQAMNYLPTMTTTTMPYLFLVEMMMGSVLYGSSTQHPEKSPATTSFGALPCQKSWDPRLWIVNNPSSVTEICL